MDISALMNVCRRDVTGFADADVVDAVDGAAVVDARILKRCHLFGEGSAVEV